MSFSKRKQRSTRRLTRAAPWVAWVIAAGSTLWLAAGVATFGVAPGEAEQRFISLASPRTAPVLDVKVAAGDRVQPGDVLAVLDPADVNLEIAIAEAELERVRLEVGAESGNVKQRELVTRERLASDAERAAVDVARLQASESNDNAELAQVDTQIARQQKLVTDGLAKASSLDELRLRRASLASAVAEAGGLLQRAAAHLSAARQRLAEWKQTGDGTQRVAPLEAAVRAQQDRVRALVAARDRLTLRAPAAARVATVHLAAGSTAREGAPVVTLVDDHPRRVVAWVDEDQAGAVQVGDTALLVASDRSATRRDGRVVALGTGIVDLPPRFRRLPTEPEFARQVFIKLEEADTPPLPGQAFDVTFRKEAAP